jgi:hypothetical protein
MWKNSRKTSSSSRIGHGGLGLLKMLEFQIRFAAGKRELIVLLL